MHDFYHASRDAMHSADYDVSVRPSVHPSKQFADVSKRFGVSSKFFYHSPIILVLWQPKRDPKFRRCHAQLGDEYWWVQVNTDGI